MTTLLTTSITYLFVFSIGYLIGRLQAYKFYKKDLNDHLTLNKSLIAKERSSKIKKRKEMGKIYPLEKKSKELTKQLLVKEKTTIQKISKDFDIDFKENNYQAIQIKISSKSDEQFSIYFFEDTFNQDLDRSMFILHFNEEYIDELLSYVNKFKIII